MSDRDNEGLFQMNNIYGMRRANGDWYAFEVRGRLRVPLFQSREAAMISRLRNFEMLLFKPVALDAQLLEGMFPVSTAREVDFCMIKDPTRSLKRGNVVEHAEVASQVASAAGAGLPTNMKASPSPVGMLPKPAMN